MSNYLSNLVARTLNLADTVQPLLGSLFEPLPESAALKDGTNFNWEQPIATTLEETELETRQEDQTSTVPPPQQPLEWRSPTTNLQTTGLTPTVAQYFGQLPTPTTQSLEEANTEASPPRPKPTDPASPSTTSAVTTNANSNIAVEPLAQPFPQPKERGEQESSSRSPEVAHTTPSLIQPIISPAPASSLTERRQPLIPASTVTTNANSNIAVEPLAQPFPQPKEIVMLESSSLSPEVAHTTPSLTQPIISPAPASSLTERRQPLIPASTVTTNAISNIAVEPLAQPFPQPKEIVMLESSSLSPEVANTTPSPSQPIISPAPTPASSLTEHRQPLIPASTVTTNAALSNPAAEPLAQPAPPSSGIQQIVNRIQQSFIQTSDPRASVSSNSQVSVTPRREPTGFAAAANLAAIPEPTPTLHATTKAVVVQPQVSSSTPYLPNSLWQDEQPTFSELTAITPLSSNKISLGIDDFINNNENEVALTHGRPDRRMQPQQGETSRNLVTPPTIIEVKIGRIEIRAAPPPTPIRPKSRPKPPVMSLDEYLRQRAKGGKQ